MITQQSTQAFLSRHNITINFLSEKAGIRPRSLYKWLKNSDATITLRTAEKLEKAMYRIASEKEMVK